MFDIEEYMEPEIYTVSDYGESDFEQRPWPYEKNNNYNADRYNGDWFIIKA